MSEARAITNLIGNAVATVVIARWDGALDLAHARRVLAGNPQEPGTCRTVAAVEASGGLCSDCLSPNWLR